MDNYIKGCQATAVKQIKEGFALPDETVAIIVSKLCSCTISQFQNKYSLEEFEGITAASKNNPEAANKLLSIGEDCFEEILYQD